MKIFLPLMVFLPLFFISGQEIKAFNNSATSSSEFSDNVSVEEYAARMEAQIYRLRAITNKVSSRYEKISNENAKAVRISQQVKKIGTDMTAIETSYRQMPVLEASQEAKMRIWRTKYDSVRQQLVRQLALLKKTLTEMKKYSPVITVANQQ